MVDKISPNDSRVQYKTAKLNGITYSYIFAEPQGTPKNTIFLIHGWPDLSLGWRYQIPFLTSLGFRVVVPDMIGYGGTDSPESPEFNTYKRAADDMAALAKELGLSSIILGGHDWGGAIVFRIAMRYPKLISAIISICTPFTPPRKEYVPASVLPNFKYQLHLAGPEVEAEIVGEEKIRQFLNGMYGGRTPSGEPCFNVGVGVLFDRLPHIGPSPLLSKEEMDFYVQRYAIHGMHGPLNWYRTGELNHADEKEFAQQMEGYKFKMPVLFVAGKKDAALPPRMSVGMEKWFVSFTRGEVDANHWALWEKPAEVNEYIRDFLVANFGASRASL
jgi:soluble epoxide hydrolase / lipid-phosphate phosphatase